MTKVGTHFIVWGYLQKIIQMCIFEIQILFVSMCSSPVFEFQFKKKKLNEAVLEELSDIFYFRCKNDKQKLHERVI